MEFLVSSAIGQESIYPRALNAIYLIYAITCVSFSSDSRYLVISGKTGLTICQVNTHFSNFEPFCHIQNPNSGTDITGVKWIDSKTLSILVNDVLAPLKAFYIACLRVPEKEIKRNDLMPTMYTIDRNWHYRKSPVQDIMSSDDDSESNDNSQSNDNSEYFV